MSDLVEWEPGQTVICMLCEGERGGDDPPGPWIRHRSTSLPAFVRRMPIFDAQRPWKPLGYFVYESD